HGARPLAPARIRTRSELDRQRVTQGLRRVRGGQRVLARTATTSVLVDDTGAWHHVLRADLGRGPQGRGLVMTMPGPADDLDRMANTRIITVVATPKLDGSGAYNVRVEHDSWVSFFEAQGILWHGIDKLTEKISGEAD